MISKQKTINKLSWSVILLLLLYSCINVSTKTQTYDCNNKNIDNAADSLIDSSFIKTLQPYKDQLEGQMSQQLAKCPEAMTSYRPESPLSNLLSDFLLDYGLKYAKDQHYDFEPDFCVMNFGGIRASLPKGAITVRNMFEIMPFENVMMYVQLSGSQVVDLCDHLASRGGEPVAGISFGIKNNKSCDIKIQGNAVDKNKKYWIVTNDYLANGGDGMKTFNSAQNKKETKEKVRDIFISEMKKTSDILNAKIERRVYNAR